MTVFVELILQKLVTLFTKLVTSVTLFGLKTLFLDFLYNIYTGKRTVFLRKRNEFVSKSLVNTLNRKIYETKRNE